MREETAERRLTKRANDFYGMTFASYVLRFTHLRELPSGEQYIWLNDNATMQKTFATWLSYDNRKAGLIAYHASQAEE